MLLHHSDFKDIIYDIMLKKKLYIVIPVLRIAFRDYVDNKSMYMSDLFRVYVDLLSQICTKFVTRL